MDRELLVVSLKMLGALIAVLAVFGGAVILFRKVSFAGKFIRRANSASRKPMEILAFQSLGPGKSLYLVRCLNKKILVGCTGQHVNHISDIYEEEASAETNEDSSFSSKIDTGIDGTSARGWKEKLSGRLREISRV